MLKPNSEAPSSSVKPHNFGSHPAATPRPRDLRNEAQRRFRQTPVGAFRFEAGEISSDDFGARFCVRTWPHCARHPDDPTLGSGLLGRPRCLLSRHVPLLGRPRNVILSAAVSWLRTLRYVGVRASRRRRREVFCSNFVRRFVGDFLFRGHSVRIR